LADPFGVTPPTSDPSGVGVYTYNLRLPGQIGDRESNLFQNWHRNYDPVTGRYIESDPIGLGGGLNTYAYVGGNPLTRIDPDGRFFFLAFFGPSLAAGLGDLAAIGSTWWAMQNAHSTPTLPDKSETQSSSETGQCPPPDDCGQRNLDVKRAKARVGTFQPAACMPGMSKWDLQQRSQAWLDLATARARRDQKCWAGGDEGHQQAQADAWAHVGRCGALLK
jgi:type VI secretion system secreted protein VgrG